MNPNISLALFNSTNSNKKSAIPLLSVPAPVVRLSNHGKPNCVVTKKGKLNLMRNSYTKFILLFILLFSNIVAEDTEMVRITLLRKGIQVVLNGQIITPKVDEELPLTAEIQSDKMGFLEFTYKGNIYRVNKNTTILVSDVIKSGAEKNFQLQLKTSSDGGVRGFDKKKKKEIKDN